MFPLSKTQSTILKLLTFIARVCIAFVLPPSANLIRSYIALWESLSILAIVLTLAKYLVRSVSNFKSSLIYFVSFDFYKFNFDIICCSCCYQWIFRP